MAGRGSTSTGPRDPTARLPEPVLAVALRLRECAGEAWLVGEALAGIAMGDTAPAGAPVGFEIACGADARDVLEAFAHAVPVAPSRVFVPTAAGPVDVSIYAPGSLTAWLARRDFRIHAAAWDPVGRAWVDPFHGLRDAAEARLGCPDDARHQLAAHPVRALRAARLVAERGLCAEPALRAAMRVQAERWQTPTPLLARRELSRMLLAPRAGAGIALLRETGLEAVLAPGAPGDAGARVDALPALLLVRLAAWLPRRAAPRFLRSHRFGHETARRLLRLLDHHPLDRHADPKREPSVRRLLRRLSPEERSALFALREAELAGAPGPDALGAAAALGALREALARIQAQDEHRRRRGALAIDGGRVMQVLGWRPGPRVGEALRHLARCVDTGEVANEPGALEEALRAWAGGRSEGGAGVRGAENEQTGP